MTLDAKKLTLVERMGGIFLGGIALLAILFLLLPFVLDRNVHVFFQITEALGAGWFEFCGRTFAAIHWNWTMIVSGAICLTAIGFSLDHFLKGFSAFVAEKRGKYFTWPARWTWCGLVAIVLFFAVGMSVGGVLHQVGWMVGSEEPMMVSLSRKYAGFSTMKQIDGAVQQALLESKDDCEKARQSVWSYLKHPETLQKQYRIFVLVDADGKVFGNFIFPLDHQEFQQTGGLVYIEGETDGGFLPMEKVKSLLLAHRDKLRQF